MLAISGRCFSARHDNGDYGSDSFEKYVTSRAVRGGFIGLAL